MMQMVVLHPLVVAVSPKAKGRVAGTGGAPEYVRLLWFLGLLGAEANEKPPAAGAVACWASPNVNGLEPPRELVLSCVDPNIGVVGFCTWLNPKPLLVGVEVEDVADGAVLLLSPPPKLKTELGLLLSPPPPPPTPPNANTGFSALTLDPNENANGVAAGDLGWPNTLVDGFGVGASGFAGVVAPPKVKRFDDGLGPLAEGVVALKENGLVGSAGTAAGVDGLNALPKLLSWLPKITGFAGSGLVADSAPNTPPNVLLCGLFWLPNTSFGGGAAGAAT